MKRNSIRKAAQRALPTLERCEVCGAVGVKLQRHHPDYSRPLDVMILCTRCHGLAHHKPPYSVTCVVCGREFVPTHHRARAKVCSRECLIERLRQCARDREGT